MSAKGRDEIPASVAEYFEKYGDDAIPIYDPFTKHMLTASDFRRKDSIEDKTMAEQIIEIALMLSLVDLIPFTRKMIIEHLPHLNKDSVNPMIQAMTVNVRGGPQIGSKYRKKVFRRVGYGQYELLESVLSPEAKKRMIVAMKGPVKKSQPPGEGVNHENA